MAFVVYTTYAGAHLELQFDGEEPWFAQADLAQMFGVDVSVVNRHISNFAADGELDPSTFAEFAIVRSEGSRKVSRPVKHYGLDVAFYVGYRVNSAEGKLFWRFANSPKCMLTSIGHLLDLPDGDGPNRVELGPIRLTCTEYVMELCASKKGT